MVRLGCMRWTMLFLTALFFTSEGLEATETVTTANFIVRAPNRQIAQQVGQYAERFRKEKALEWLGKEMPPWGQKCPLNVKLTMGGPGGATTFAFDQGAILEQEMNVEGDLERILNSVLPYEITHTVLAYHFRQPLPRWADEGGSVLSEDDKERRRHDDLVRQSLAGGRGFRLRYLFELKDYPRSSADVMTLYAQGYSIVRFLVEKSSKPAFLNFLADGSRYGWDQALRNHYRFDRIEALEEAWLNWMRNGMRHQIAANDAPVRSTHATSPTSMPQNTNQAYTAGLGKPTTIRGSTPWEQDSVRTTKVTANPSPTGTNLPGWSPLGGTSNRTSSQQNSVQLLPPRIDD